MLKRIPLELITRNPDQPRQSFDAQALRELADSIRENGLQQPITVRPIERDGEGHEYMIVAGERRFRAHQLLAEDGDFVNVLCHVRRMDDETMHVNAILENLQRADVSPMEEAVAYQRMIEDFGFTPESLAKKLGISQSWRIPYRTRLLDLTEDNRGLLEKGVITNTQAYHMAALSPDGQQEFLRLCRAGLVGSDKAAASAAANIAAKEAQVEMPMPEQPRPRVSAASVITRIDRLGAAVQPFFKEGAATVPAGISVSDAETCLTKLRALKKNIAQIEAAVTESATSAALA